MEGEGRRAYARRPRLFSVCSIVYPCGPPYGRAPPVPAALMIATSSSPLQRDAALVRVSGLSKRFPVVRSWGEVARKPFARTSQTALSDVGLEVAEGEFFGLLGPNGAGKTTLFKILCTSILPDEGEATIGGIDVLAHPERVREFLTPVLANERSLNWRLSGVENLRMYAALYGIHGPEARRRIDDVLSVVDLAGEHGKAVAKYSSGMKQRLLIARALMTRPRVLLLDEPTRSLDPVSAGDFRTFLREEIVARQGCTVLLATHSPEDVLELCDRVGVINRGRLIEVGEPADLMRRYGDEVYRLAVRVPSADAHTNAVADLLGTFNGVTIEREEAEGWRVVTMPVDGGRDASADVIRRLVVAGADIAEFERVRLSLADLITRIVTRKGHA